MYSRINAVSSKAVPLNFDESIINWPNEPSFSSRWYMSIKLASSKGFLVFARYSKRLITLACLRSNTCGGSAHSRYLYLKILSSIKSSKFSCTSVINEVSMKSNRFGSNWPDYAISFASKKSSTASCSGSSSKSVSK